MKKKIDRYQLKTLILDGASSEEINSNYDYSEIINYSFMFYKNKNLKYMPYIDTSNATNMGYMFDGCINLISVPNLIVPQNTKTGKFINYAMFLNCINLRDVDPYHYKDYLWSNVRSDSLKERFPELYI